MATLAYKKARLLPDDILAAVLSLAGQSRFKGHNFKLQSVFHSLVQEHAQLLGQYFVFSDAGPEPYSPELSDAISRLQLSGLVGRENPDYEVVIVKEATRQYYENVLHKVLEPEQVEELNEIARAFAARISAAE